MLGLLANSLDFGLEILQQIARHLARLQSLGHAVEDPGFEISILLKSDGSRRSPSSLPGPSTGGACCGLVTDILVGAGPLTF